MRARRLALGIHPEFGEVDTCAGEFEAKTPYYYSYYSAEDRMSLVNVANVKVLPITNTNDWKLATLVLATLPHWQHSQRH